MKNPAQVQWLSTLVRRRVSIVIKIKQSFNMSMKIITNTKCKHTLSLIALTCGMLAVSIGQASAQTDQDLVEVARAVVKADRQAVVVATMELTEAEGKGFWPLYHEYRFE